MNEFDTGSDDIPERPCNMNLLKEQAEAACGPGCCCSSTTEPKGRWATGLVILLFAVFLALKAGVKAQESLPSMAETGFVATGKALALSSQPIETIKSAPAQTPTHEAAVKTQCGELITALAELNQKAASNDGVFVFLEGNDKVKNAEISKVVEAGAISLGRSNFKIGVFILDRSSAEHASLARQFKIPGVIAMVRGRGVAAVGDDITESKLFQAFLSASSAGGGHAGRIFRNP